MIVTSDHKRPKEIVQPDYSSLQGFPVQGLWRSPLPRVPVYLESPRRKLGFTAVKSQRDANCKVTGGSDIGTPSEVYLLSVLQATLPALPLCKNTFWNASVGNGDLPLVPAKGKQHNSPEELCDFCILLPVSRHLSNCLKYLFLGFSSIFRSFLSQAVPLVFSDSIF